MGNTNLTNMLFFPDFQTGSFFAHYRLYYLMDCENIVGAVQFISRRLGRRSSRITEIFESLCKVILADETGGMYFGRISHVLEDFLGNPLVGLVPGQFKMFEFNCLLQAALLSVRLSVFKQRIANLRQVRELEREMRNRQSHSLDGNYNNAGDYVHLSPVDLKQWHSDISQVFLSCQIETDTILRKTRLPVFLQLLGKTQFDLRSIQYSLTTPGQSVLLDTATNMGALFIEFFEMRLNNLLRETDLALIIEEQTESHNVSESDTGTVQNNLANQATALVEHQLLNHLCQGTFSSNVTVD